jgi:hypothetical protein
MDSPSNAAPVEGAQSSLTFLGARSDWSRI